MASPARPKVIPGARKAPKLWPDKLYHEHIYWDQASVLVQIGKLDPTGLPVAGVETADKVKDKSLPSNTLMARWAESAPA